MELKKGFTATAMFLAVAMLRGSFAGPSASPSPEQIRAQADAPAQTASANNGDGPWRASCNYWKPGQTIPDPDVLSSAGESKRTSGSKITSSQAGELTSEVTRDTADDTHPCGKDGWGIPTPGSGAQSADLGITAIIATLPDPLHSSMSLDFDRYLEVLAEAASAYRYVSSYSWLPWRRPPANTKLSDLSQTASADDLARERQPGLLILKQSFAVPLNPATPVPDYPRERDRLIYIFLVGQSPALGVNGEQLQNALQYERHLQMTYGAQLSFLQPKLGAAQPSTLQPSHVLADIIGPENSGGAASLCAGLAAAHRKWNYSFRVAGVTSTKVSTDELNVGSSARANTCTSAFKAGELNYFSFGDDSRAEQDAIEEHFSSQDPTSRSPTQLALLIETGTLFGLQEAHTRDSPPQENTASYNAGPTRQPPLVIYYPRGISVLRNAASGGARSGNAEAVASLSPYLHLTLKDSSGEDSIASFSAQTSYSQEAQWMAIVRQLRNHQVRVVGVSASNVLDLLFLIKSIRRDTPDVQVVIYDYADLLFARIGDSDPYLGTINVTAYPLTDLASSSLDRPVLHSFSDTKSEALFNAASFLLWDPQSFERPHLVDYSNPFTASVGRTPTHPPLWATVVGRDGYYPLGILSDCASRNPFILPAVPATSPSLPCVASTLNTAPRIPEIESSLPTGPGFSWYLLCGLITVLGTAHGLGLLSANFWSPLTRDLAISGSDQPRRRSVYTNIAAAILVSLSATAVMPVIATWHLLHPHPYTIAAAILASVSGVFAAVATLAKTHRFLGTACAQEQPRFAACIEPRQEAFEDMARESRLYPFFNVLAALTAMTVPAIWWRLCTDNYTNSTNSYLGVFFSYRCLFPGSGVCPLLPITLVLLTWYLWAHLQTKRLRFSENSRPMLPPRMQIALPTSLYVSDEALSDCSRATSSCLYEKITCLLITRQLIRRTVREPDKRLNLYLGLAYLVLYAVFVLFMRVYGLDHYFRGDTKSYLPGPYEFLIESLFYPLLVIAITGCLRLLVIWSAMNRGLLEPLERSPMRFAFDRIQGASWITMFRQGGLFEYWRDMARSIESMQQLLNLRKDSWDPAFHDNPLQSSSATEAALSLHRNLAALQSTLSTNSSQPLYPQTVTVASTEQLIGQLSALCNSAESDVLTKVPYKPENHLVGCDLPDEASRTCLNLMCAIECDFANFGQAVLSCVLAPFWLRDCNRLVENDAPTSSSNDEKAKAKNTTGTELLAIQLAEEFLAIRYVSLIRAVLVNLRYLTTFVSSAFVIALLAWNSYPFQPRQWVDWTFTLLLFGFGGSVIWVYAQMHRSPILSRITDTDANKLGAAFFYRLLTFGAVPVLTWLASQFPSISQSVGALLQSGLGAAK